LHTTRVTVCPNSGSAQLGVLAPVLAQNEVSKIVLPQNKTLTLIEVLNLTLSGVYNFFLSPNEVFKNITVNCQLFNNVKTTVKTVLNLGLEGFKHLISMSICGGEKLCCSIRILLESFSLF
jgi:hypothetical protein